MKTLVMDIPRHDTAIKSEVSPEAHSALRIRAAIQETINALQKLKNFNLQFTTFNTEYDGADFPKRRSVNDDHKNKVGQLIMELAANFQKTLPVLAQSSLPVTQNLPDLQNCLQNFSAGDAQYIGDKLHKKINERAVPLTKYLRALWQPLACTYNQRVDIRWMIRRDLPEVTEISRLQHHPLTEDEILKMCKSPHVFGMVATEYPNAEIIGYILYEIYVSCLRILRIETHPQFDPSIVESQLLNNRFNTLEASGRIEIVVPVPERETRTLIRLRENFLRADEILPSEECGEECGNEGIIPMRKSLLIPADTILENQGRFVA